MFYGCENIDNTILEEKGSNPAIVELKLKKAILSRIELLAKNLDINLLKNIYVIFDSEKKQLQK